MADMNVMNLIRKKEPKKLRGFAGAAAKKRLASNTKKTSVNIKTFKNSNRFKSFLFVR